MLISSNKYNNRKDGNAINNKIIAGKIVQIISINWPDKKNLLVILLIIIEIIKYPTKIVIIIKINIEWSWKKINCSIKGEFLFCKFKLDQVAIFYLWILNSLHLSVKLKF